MSGEDELRAAAPNVSLLLLAGTRHSPHVHVEVVRAGQHQLVRRPAEAAALLGAAVVVAGMVELAHLHRARHVVEDRRQAAADTQQLSSRPVEPERLGKFAQIC